MPLQPGEWQPSATEVTAVQASDVVKTMRAHDPGSARWRERFGDQLVCVRYRRGRDPARRYTTVELVVDSRPLTALPDARAQAAAPRAAMMPMLKVKIARPERDLRIQARQAGGRCEPDGVTWTLTAEAVDRLGWAERVLQEPF